MNKITMISVVTAALLFTGCGEKAKDSATDAAAKAVESTKEAASHAAEATKEAAAKAAEATKEAAEKAVEATKEAVDATKEVATTATEAVADTAKNVAGAAAYAKCAACHGADGKTKAMGKSPVLSGQDKETLVTKIKGYKAGTINVSGMGTLMKGQVASMDDATIDAVATYISTLK